MSEASERIYDEVWARDTAARLTDEQIVRYIYAPNSAHLTKAIRSRLADRIEALERENAALRDDDAKMQLLHQQEDQLIAAEADKARLSEALREALAANERDRTEIVIAVNALTDAFARRDWLIRGGRGSYEWDDDRFRDEFRDAMEEFQPHIDQLRKIGADRTNCPKTQAEVIAARAALSDEVTR